MKSSLGSKTTFGYTAWLWNDWPTSSLLLYLGFNAVYLLQCTVKIVLQELLQRCIGYTICFKSQIHSVELCRPLPVVPLFVCSKKFQINIPKFVCPMHSRDHSPSLNIGTLHFYKPLIHSGNVPYWHFNKICHIIIALHVYDKSFKTRILHRRLTFW